MEPGPSRTIPVQNNEYNAAISSSSDWTNEPAKYFVSSLTWI